MYFASRVQAGRMLANRLHDKYRYENCIVLAIDDGGVMVGAQIAMKLHCAINMMLSEEIVMPRDNEALVGITANGTTTYNRHYSQGQIDEYNMEYFNLIEQEKLSKMRDMNRLVSSAGTVSKNMLRGHNVIVVSDGLASGFKLDLVAEFLKPISIEKLIVAVPFASVKAVDRMHILGDDLECLNVVSDYISTEHYYDQQDVPDRKTAVELIEKIILNWK
jgi:putative phosphoribosyl transferase